MKWGDIPVAAKMATASVVAIMAIISYLTTFQTDAEAMEYQQRHGKELQQVRIQQIQARIDDYEYRLLSGNLTPEQREWIKRKIASLEETKSCIRKGEC